MKKGILFFTTCWLFVVSGMAQEKLYVYQKDGTCAEFAADQVESIGFEMGVQPHHPNDTSFVAKPFTVGWNHQVYFSPGNLQYHAVNREWRFAPNQTDYIGAANVNISNTYNGWIDQFGWGTGGDPTRASTTYADYGKFVDWGSNKIGDYPPNTWYTMSHNEWEYIIKYRDNANQLLAIAQVNGVNGLILLPDNWLCPADVTLKTGLAKVESSAEFANFQVIEKSDWFKLQHAGAVFLPAAGVRNGLTVKIVQEAGYYWTAPWHSVTSGAIFYFNSCDASIQMIYIYDGSSVRLVTDTAY